MKRKKTATVEVIKDTNIVSEPVVTPSVTINPEPIVNNTSPVPNNFDPAFSNFDVNKTIITKDVDLTRGTCLRGFVDTTYEELKSTLGEPLTGRSGDGKTTCEWILKFNCNSVATIYDWKMGQTPKGPYQWHIGGTGIDVVKKVGMFLKKPTSRVEY